MFLVLRLFLYLVIVLFFIIFLGQLVISFPKRYKKVFTGIPEFNTLVMVPCKGIDYTMDENLKSLLNQEYENYDIIAIVDSQEDPAVRIIEGNKIDYIISNFNSKGSGKVRALSTALRDYGKYEAYVIADSDIVVDKNWLETVLQPLTDPQFGLSTSFPYFEPKGGFWSKFKTVWGFVGLGMMQSDITVFGWGGTLAFRRDFLTDSDLKFFSNAISDDMALTEICKNKGQKIAFANKCKVSVNSPDNYEIFKEWSIRQTSLLLSRTPKAYGMGILLYGSSALLIIGSLFLSLFISPLFLIFYLPLILNQWKMYSRLRDKKIVYFLIQIIIPFFYVWNLRKASKNMTITWRGSEYNLYSK
jgi:cellulose synthase/poly-beta-1,6-N-acetylglucosamine synthase-like glycosyltransferase